MSSVQSVAARVSRSLARAVFSILLFSLFVIACQPSNCQTTSTTARITCSGTSPGDSCPAPMVRTCVKQCRAVAGQGEACVVDPCNAAEGKICDRNLGCVPDSAGSATGKCGPALAECDPNAAASDTNRCQAGTHCIPYVEVAGAPQDKRAACAMPDIFTSKSPKGMCMPFIPEGEMCDSDARPGETLPLDEVSCRACEPGTTCVRPAGERSGTCLRPCDKTRASESCPCQDVCTQAVSVESSAAGDYCSHCVATKATCRMDGTDHVAACCNPDDTCFGKTCCRRAGKACSEKSECCGTDVCASGTCAACKAEGVSASDARECCEGLVIENVAGRGSVCSQPCGAPGQPCCLGTTCDTGTVCGGGKCQSCGGVGQACCAGNACTTGTCTSGVCKAAEACGVAGKTCCPGSTCSDGSSCVSGTCQSCGSDGQKCCGTDNICKGKPAGADSNAKMVCQYPDTPQEVCATRSVTCGRKGTPCCTGTCDPGLSCYANLGCQ